MNVPLYIPIMSPARVETPRTPIFKMKGTYLVPSTVIFLLVSRLDFVGLRPVENMISLLLRILPAYYPWLAGFRILVG